MISSLRSESKKLKKPFKINKYISLHYQPLKEYICYFNTSPRTEFKIYFVMIPPGSSSGSKSERECVGLYFKSYDRKRYFGKFLYFVYRTHPIRRLSVIGDTIY